MLFKTMNPGESFNSMQHKWILCKEYRISAKKWFVSQQYIIVFDYCQRSAWFENKMIKFF